MATSTGLDGPGVPVPLGIPGSEVSAADGPNHDVVGSRRTLIERSWWTAAGVVLVMWSLQLFDAVDSYPWTSAVLVVVGLWGLVTVACSLLTPSPLARRPDLRRAAAAGTLVVTLVAFGSWSFVQVRQGPAYGTDEIAFDQYAASLAVHGDNPYTHSMAPSFARYQVSPDGYTFQLDGHPITTLSYPALAFEVYMPFLAAGWSTQLAVVINVVAWMVAILLLFVLLPRRLKPMAIVIGSLSVYVGYAVGGVTDALFVPLLIGAAVAWNRFGTRAGPRWWLGPILLGLAMAVKQTPWFVLPFVVTGIVLERRATSGTRRGVATGLQYVAIAAAAFLVPNLPYIAASPAKWFGGVLTPIFGHAVPAGQGAVGLSLFLGLGGGSLSAYSLTAALLFVALWLAYTLTYPLLRPWAFFVPSLVLFFSARSFGSYLVDLVPAAMVAAVTLDHSADHRFGARWRHWKLALSGAGAACVVAFVVAVASPAPLTVSVTGIRTTGALATIEQVTVRVHNRSGSPVTPAFTVNEAGSVTTFWPATGGPTTIRPHRQAVYTLLAPNFFAMPPLGSGFEVDAYSGSPPSVSRSAAYLPATWHVALVPVAIDAPVAVGSPVRVRAELLDSADRPVHTGGVLIDLGQIIYDQAGLEYAKARINSGQIGQSPVGAFTDAQGVATFVVRGTQTGPDPVYFEANLVNARPSYPYGYSAVLPIRFSSSR
jgi:uncharacterized membrane protein